MNDIKSDSNKKNQSCISPLLILSLRELIDDDKLEEGSKDHNINASTRKKQVQEDSINACTEPTLALQKGLSQ